MTSEAIAPIQSLLALLALISVLYLGFALLALIQERDRRTLGIAGRAATVLLRVAGYGLIAVVLPIALWRNGPGFAALLWATLISIGALAVVCTLT